MSLARRLFSLLRGQLRSPGGGAARGARALQVAALAGLVAAGGGCADILGYGGYEFGGSGGGAGASGGAGGTGGAGACATDVDCAGSPYGPVCDAGAGECVECLPGPPDTCAFGLYCGADRRCLIGCAASADCNQDGQNGPLTCDEAAHQCQGCTDSAPCPPGSKCDPEVHVCLPGCDGTPECPTADWQCCTGQCQNVTKDVQHCGACDDPCDPAASTTWLCLAGACVFQSCLAGFADCDQNLAEHNGCEVSTATDAAHCGGCGQACELAHAGAVCLAGQCAIGSCNAPFQDCDGLPGNGCETDTSESAGSCGGCGQSCEGAYPHTVPTCSGGACLPGACEAGFGDCNGVEVDGCEVDLGTSLPHCGGCGDACALPNAVPACSGGACVIASCGGGFDDCDGDAGNGCEVNLSSDATSCGACGKACVYANAAGVCSGGDCELGACESGFADCDGVAANGCETNLETGVASCGACGNVCGAQGASAVACVAGLCQILCDATHGDCDGASSNGCETSVQDSVNHCGTCGNVCPAGGGTPHCVGGTCGISSCGAGLADCDGNGTCETSTTTPQDCGSCGDQCSTNHTAQVACTGSPLGCVLTCEGGWGDCNNNPADGCEQTLTTNQHCTACGVACQAPHANTSCASGACQILSCQPGYANCNGNPLDGCETSLATDINHCGTCGNVCDPAHANGQCTGGVCEIQQCDSGYLDCNSSPNDGCEVDKTTDVFHCGACGNTCSFPNAQATCASPGVCQIGACAAGFANCDGAAANGCEVSTQTSLSHCGACNNICSGVNGTAQCSLGTCAINCNGGWGNCNNLASDGCETSLATLASCGACGALCDLPNATESCATGMCTLGACSAGHVNCDQNPANGCECGPNAGCAGMVCLGP